MDRKVVKNVKQFAKVTVVEFRDGTKAVMWNDAKFHNWFHVGTELDVKLETKRDFRNPNMQTTWITDAQLAGLSKPIQAEDASRQRAIILQVVYKEACAERRQHEMQGKPMSRDEFKKLIEDDLALLERILGA